MIEAKASNFGRLATSLDAEQRSADISQKFLTAVEPRQRNAVERLINDIHAGGGGLRTWIASLEFRGAIFPKHIPAELIDVYLTDSEAAPWHDCEDCGIAIPVRMNRLHDPEAEPDYIYFSECPACGGRTGWYLHRSRQAARMTTFALRRNKPR
jgi:hypothetical protein